MISEGDFSFINVLFLDAVVCQMNELIAQIFLICWVLMGADSGKPLLINISFKGVDWSHKHINSEVELVPIKKQRVHQIFLKHHRLSENDIFYLIHEFDSPSSTHSNWLHDPVIIIWVLDRWLTEFSDKLHIFARQVEGLRNDIECGLSFLPEFLYFLNVFLEQVFPGNFFVPKEVINFLEVAQEFLIDLRPRPSP